MTYGFRYLRIPATAKTIRNGGRPRAGAGRATSAIRPHDWTLLSCYSLLLAVCPSFVRSSTAPLIEAHARNGSARLTETEEERGTEECRRNSQDRLLPNGSRDSISRHPMPANPARQRAHQRETRPATRSLITRSYRRKGLLHR